jgi:hypothetical protein
MKKKYGLILICAAIFLASLFYFRSEVSAQPGDMTDPVVTKSYVDGQISQLMVLINQLNAMGGGQPTAVAPYETVFASEGRMLIAESGTEIILRGGSAIAITGINGLCDVTSGNDILNGTEIPLNHLLLVPASDGRGLVATKDAYLMIKGGYYFVE